MGRSFETFGEEVSGGARSADDSVIVDSILNPRRAMGNNLKAVVGEIFTGDKRCDPKVTSGNTIFFSPEFYQRQE